MNLSEAISWRKLPVASRKTWDTGRRLAMRVGTAPQRDTNLFVKSAEHRIGILRQPHAGDLDLRRRIRKRDAGERRRVEGRDAGLRQHREAEAGAHQANQAL